jgi:T5SS/PEP-CTERM-associated repeat protein/autotransporter-associated beta strand protein
VGYGADSIGTATVTGAGSEWRQFSLYVGSAGTGTLQVENGGTVSTNWGVRIGDVVGGTGTVTVTGVNSTWNAGTGPSDDLYVGGPGTGTLTVADSARVNVTLYVGPGARRVNINSLSTVNIGVGGLAGILDAGEILNNGTLNFNHTDAISQSAAISGTGTINKTGAGTMTLPNASAFAGRFVSSGGELILQGSLNATLYAATPGGTLRFDGSTVNMGGVGAIRASGGAVEYVAATINGGILRGDLPGTGTHTIVASGFADTIFNGVTIQNSVDLVQNGYANFTNVTNGGRLTSNEFLFFDGGVNTTSGHIIVNQLLSTRDFTNSGQITVNSGGELRHTLGNLASGGGSRTTVNAGGIITLLGGAELDLNGALLVNNGTINGTTNVNYGSLAKGTGSYGVVNVTQGGVFSPGNSPGTVTVESLNIADTSVIGAPILAIELAGTQQGSQYDHVNVTGALSLGGALNVSLLAGFTPSAGDSFDILDWGSLSGVFSSLNLPALASLAWDTSQLYTTGTLSLIAAGLPGDYNQNGTVDAADYVVWRKNLGNVTSLANDDTPGVGPDDYTRWRAHFGNSSGSSAAAGPASSANAAVPEPASLMLLALGGLLAAFVFVRRHRSFLHRTRAALAGQALLLIVGFVGESLAATATWTGAAGNGNWSDIGNWSAAVYPATGDSVVFGSSGQTNVRADFSSYPVTDPQVYDQPPLHLESLTFDAAAPAYMIELYSTAPTGGPFYQANLELDGAGVVNLSGQPQTFSISRGAVSGDVGGTTNGIDGSSLTFNDTASAGSATYNVEGGITDIRPFGGGEGAFRPLGGSVFFNGTASAANGTFIAAGGSGDGGRWAVVEFHGSSTAASGTFTNNGGVLGAGFGGTQATGYGAQTTFFDNATAGAASFTNHGNANLANSAGMTVFSQYSSAASGVFVNHGGTGANASGGATGFSGNATGGSGMFTNNGGTAESARGGWTQFHENSSAGNSTIINNGGATIFAEGGHTDFRGASTAGFATITNAAPTGLYGYPGKTSFHDSASAGSAVITNLPSDATRLTTTDFYGTSTAASATIINMSGAYPTVPGITTFHDSSSAGSGTFINESGGQFIFVDSSTAGQGSFSNGEFGGLVIFKENSNAGQANINLRGTQNSVLQFYDDSSAGAANIDVGRLILGPTNESNLVQFSGNSTAADSTITVRGDGGSLSFAGSSFDPQNPSATAGNALITALGSARPGNIPGTIGGQVLFNSYSTAGNATITAQGATVDGAPGGLIVFLNGGHAGNATLIANGGTTSANGGGIRFQSGGIGDSARLVVNAGASADFSHNAFHGGTAVGSIEGAGRFSLGGSLLTVGNLNTSTTVSGNIKDSGGLFAGIGGMLTKVGTGTLTLSGANTHTGLTTVDEGTVIVNGSIAGGALVKDGGILKGSGAFGNVDVEAGGVFAPGTSPGTSTVKDFTLRSGSRLDFELGVVRDHIVVTNNGNISLGGILNVSLLDGFIPAEPTLLFEGAIGSITGAFSAVNAPVFNGQTLSVLYSANQVMLQVVALPPGDYNQNGTVDAADYVVWRKGLGTTFTPNDYNVWRANFGQTAGSGSGATASVPEPSSVALLLVGMLAVFSFHRATSAAQTKRIEHATILL